MPSFALVHSPLVGPSTWKWVAETLTARAYRVTVPAGPPADGSFTWETFADSIAAQISQEDHVVLIGHSGAGPLLPQIRARASREPAALIFVDAAVPPESGDAALIPSRFRGQLQAMARGGLLPEWPAWFGPGVMETLIPDPQRRAAVCGDLPQLPLSYFDARVPQPRGWATVRCGYVQLSDTYAAEAAEARRRRWPVRELPGTHLDIVTRPGLITDAITALADQLTGRDRRR